MFSKHQQPYYYVPRLSHFPPRFCIPHNTRVWAKHLLYVKQPHYSPPNGETNHASEVPLPCLAFIDTGAFLAKRLNLLNTRFNHAKHALSVSLISIYLIPISLQPPHGNSLVSSIPFIYLFTF